MSSCYQNVTIETAVEVFNKIIIIGNYSIIPGPTHEAYREKYMRFQGCQHRDEKKVVEC